MLIDKTKCMDLKDWRAIRKTVSKDSGPYFIMKPRPETPLKGLEVEYAKTMGGPYWDDWMVAVRSLGRRSRSASRRAFMELWLDDIHDAQRIAWAGPYDNYDIGFVVWPPGVKQVGQVRI